MSSPVGSGQVSDSAHIHVLLVSNFDDKQLSVTIGNAELPMLADTESNKCGINGNQYIVSWLVTYL